MKKFLQAKRWWWAGLGGALVVGLMAVAACAPRAGSHPEVGQTRAAAEDGEPEVGAVSVKTIHPKSDPSFVISVEEPAYVEAYYTADLQAREAGPVKFIKKDIGDPVTAGELLVWIDVPALEQEVDQKEAFVTQRRQELDVARKNVEEARAALAIAEDTIKEKDANVQSADATRTFRWKELQRFRQLVRGDPARGIPSGTVTEDVLDEREQFYEAADAASRAARAAVQTAKSDRTEYKAKLDAAYADVQLKEALVKVAEKDRDRTRALADYAKITAPFDGVITHRNVDPGSFVQNAATAHTQSLVTVDRTDIVTVYMKVPDNYAPYVTKDTEAVIEMSELPGQLIHGKVSRFSPSLHNPEHDRTMRVEVDLYNGTEKEYQAFLAKETAKKDPFDDLKGNAKPILPQVTGKNAEAEAGRLLPGMFGKMQLVLRKFKNAYLLPSSAIISMGGKPYIYEVRNDAAHLVPVEVQVDDGKLAKVAVIARVGKEEVKRNLTGDEEVVASNQGEISDGQPVRPVLKDW